ncbi:MAG: replicative DNA helicase [Cyanobacteria bacterium P01_A01_bin.37]
MPVDEKLDLDFRLPPQNVDAEAYLLGCLLAWGNALERVSPFLRAEHFYVRYNACIYQACIDLNWKNSAVDLVSVSSLLSDRQALEQCGGKLGLMNLVDLAVTDVNIEEYAHIIIDKWKRRRLIAIASEIQKSAYNSQKPWNEIIEIAEKEVFSLSDSSEQKGLVHISALTCGEYERIEQVSETGISPGIPSGFYDLDEMTQGYQPHQLIIVAGRPAMGKTSFVAHQLKNISASLPCALFSLEMSGGQIAQRMLSEQCQIESGRLVSGRIGDEEWGRLSQSVASLSGLNLWVDESMQITPTHILSQCRRLKSEHGKLGMIAVDYLHLMLDGNDDTRELGKLTRQFKRMARELDCPIILCSQLSRAVENRNDKRPVMSDLRQSGAIEQDADIVMFLYRDEYYNQGSPDKGIAEVLVRKHRGGPVGTIKLLFEPEFASFRNIAKGF